MPRSWAILLGLAMAAGCLGAAETPASTSAPEAESETLATAVEADATETLPTLGPAVDPWLPGEVERVLFDETVEAGECYLGATAFELLYAYLMGGCAFVELPAGTLIPEGTGALHMEVDASGAQRQGEYLGFLYTSVRQSPEEANGGGTSEAKHTWDFPLVPDEWDTPTRERSLSLMGLWTANSVLQGPVAIRVVAERDPAWIPAAPLDHWAMAEAHAFPQPGVITLADETIAWQQPGRVSTWGWPSPPVLEDRVPPATRTLVVAASWSAPAGCLPIETCELLVDLVSGNAYWNGYRRVADERAPTHAIYLFSVPEEVEADPDFRTVTATRPHLGFYTHQDQYATCDDGLGFYCLPAADVASDVRFLVEAWRDPVDLSAVKVRLGVT